MAYTYLLSAFVELGWMRLRRRQDPAKDAAASSGDGAAPDTRAM